jgi:hypothetical protein
LKSPGFRLANADADCAEDFDAHAAIQGTSVREAILAGCNPDEDSGNLKEFLSGSLNAGNIGAE